MKVNILHLTISARARRPSPTLSNIDVNWNHNISNQTVDAIDKPTTEQVLVMYGI